ncbi:DUF3825 domain-containing protein [Lacticaseibacillus paracasei subsp. paracasei]|uniref:DUF3825 domain-containing protein n=1 Tax=Lacticaseibacillus paracasei TaxID=1597 RepID=UPI001E3A5BFD|nr:DUF3825 domain-containing protein [Lacticaseibacillus paracasei]MCD0433123.1 DUF3825 domain-containing protein [Lacticaseibacillus paracasei subsp. paracasei]
MNEFPDDLFDFAWLAHKNTTFNQYMDELKEKAQDEDWGEENKILKNYLSFTYKYLAQSANKELEETGKTNLILISDQAAVFNTGLFDDFYEPIYAYFQKNRNTGTTTPKPWFFIGFKSAGDYELLEFTTLPNRMNYFSKPEELVFDPRIPIRTNVQHILGDTRNMERLPEIFQDYDKSSLSTILNGSIEMAKKKAASNYTVAVPQFYKGKLQLLLPITLPGSNNPDLALTISKGDHIYSGNTCLTIAMAYNNARLITKPSSTWLLPED